MSEKENAEPEPAAQTPSQKSPSNPQPPSQLPSQPPPANSHEDIEGYEKIRVVGKGAFGLAVLYRCLTDNELVVIKEVNIIELSASERQFALNEVQVLASLDHPNIISYRRSFERGGQLMIEMEYADGGNLNQLLARRTNPFSERAVLHIYRQITAALQHMHERGVLHRDLKTANIFLTKNFVVKVGDFGISKLLTTRAQAQTILGTPYYISPEMCEGKQYGPASDIWASGCILYEMICLEKAFEATNLPALVNKIVRGQFAPIPETYSPGLADLVGEILQREPEARPSAAIINEERLPPLLEAAEKDALDRAAKAGKSHVPQATFFSLDLAHEQPHGGKIRSVLYLWRSHNPTMFDLEPLMLPTRSKILQVAVGEGHVLVVTSELLVYSWGEGSRGQLGHDDSYSISQPKCVESLRGKSINKVCAGYEFSIFGSESGVLMSCGAGEGACLGHGDWADSPRPRIIEKLLHVDVAQVVSGSHHVLALSSKGDVFSWGVGFQGRLGHGNEQNILEPEQVTLPSGVTNNHVIKIRAGPDCSAIITTTGELIAWGSNSNNKLVMDRRTFCSFLREVDAVWLPTAVPLGMEISDISLGLRNAVIIDPSGKAFVTGSDPGRVGKHKSPELISAIGSHVTMATCGPEYIVAGTADNVVYFWGVRHSMPPAGQGTIGQKPRLITEHMQHPEEILALYGSEDALSRLPMLSVGGLYPAPAYEIPGALLLLLHTTAPLVPADMDQQNIFGEHGKTSKANMVAANPSKPTTMIPEWLKVELAAAGAQHR